MIRIMVRIMMCHFYVYPFGSDPVMYLKTVEKEWNLLSSLEGEFVILFSVLLCQLGVVKSLESNFTSPSYQISNAFSIAINIATCNHHQNHQSSPIELHRNKKLSQSPSRLQSLWNQYKDLWEEVVNEGAEGKPVRPAVGEVGDVHILKKLRRM